jgi:hypothetical protein
LTSNDDRSYWNNKGKYQKEADTLAKLVPNSGEASDPKVDLFRRVQNLYYEIFNNGGGNLEGEGNDFEVVRLEHEGFRLPIVSRMIVEQNKVDENYELIGDPHQYFEQAQVEMDNVMDKVIEQITGEKTK